MDTDILEKIVQFFSFGLYFIFTGLSLYIVLRVLLSKRKKAQCRCIEKYARTVDVIKFSNPDNKQKTHYYLVFQLKNGKIKRFQTSFWIYDVTDQNSCYEIEYKGLRLLAVESCE